MLVEPPQELIGFSQYYSREAIMILDETAEKLGQMNDYY